MKTKPNDIKGLLRNFKHYEVSPDLDAKILKALDNARLEKEVMHHKPSFFTLLQGYLKSFNRYVAIPVAMLLVFVGGGIYYTQTSYGYHLGKAKSTLIKLESAVKGDSYQAYIISRALAANELVDEEIIAKLTHKVVRSTEKAIEIAERIDNPQELQNAFVEINKVQEKEVEVFADAVEVVKVERVAEVVAVALENTAAQEESIDKAVEVAKKAIKEKKKEIKVDIQTTIDRHEELMKEKRRQAQMTLEKIKEEKLKKAEAQYESMSGIIANLKEEGATDEQVSKLQEKLTEAKHALNEGRIGAARGLTTAVKVKTRNIKRHLQLKKVLIEKKENQDIPEDVKDVPQEGINTKEDAVLKNEDKIDTKIEDKKVNIDLNKAKKILDTKEIERLRLQAIEKKKKEDRLRLERLKNQKKRIEDALRKKRAADAAKKLLDSTRSRLAPTSGSLPPKTIPDTPGDIDAISGEPITNNPVEEKHADDTSDNTDSGNISNSTDNTSDTTTNSNTTTRIDIGTGTSSGNTSDSTSSVSSGVTKETVPTLNSTGEADVATADSVKTNTTNSISPLKLHTR